MLVGTSPGVRVAQAVAVVRHMLRACLPPLQADSGNHLIRAVNVTSGAVTTLAGRQGVSTPFSDGIGTGATFNNAQGVSIDGTGAFAVVVRPWDHTCVVQNDDHCMLMRLTVFPAG
jgi:hypothetical protein